MNFYEQFTRHHFLILIQNSTNRYWLCIWEKQQTLEGKLNLKSKGLGWVSTMKFMWLRGKIITLNCPWSCTLICRRQIILQGENYQDESFTYKELSKEVSYHIFLFWVDLIKDSKYSVQNPMYPSKETNWISLRKHDKNYSIFGWFIF